MSRIGRKPVVIPEKVKCNLTKNVFTVEGPKGKLTIEVHPRVEVNVGEKDVTVARRTNLGPDRALHGLTRALIANMVEGVTNGFSKKLLIEGVGYRAQAQGKKLNLTLGFSHPVVMDVPAELSVATPEPTVIEISGIDKQQVGQLAANIRRLRPAEPYKGKGLRYDGERIRRKAGKSGK